MQHSHTHVITYNTRGLIILNVCCIDIIDNQLTSLSELFFDNTKVIKPFRNLTALNMHLLQ